jgi:hypothetical protein
MLDGKTHKASKAVKLSRAKGQFVHIELLDIPRENISQGPQANIARLVQGLSLKVGSDGNDLAMSVAITTKEEKQAKQVRQMIQGVTAMIQLVDDGGEDEHLQQTKEFLENLKVKRKGNVVQVRLTVPEADLVELIEGEMSEI